MKKNIVIFALLTIFAISFFGKTEKEVIMFRSSGTQKNQNNFFDPVFWVWDAQRQQSIKMTSQELVNFQTSLGYNLKIAYALSNGSMGFYNTEVFIFEK